MNHGYATSRDYLHHTTTVTSTLCTTQYYKYTTTTMIRINNDPARTNNELRRQLKQNAVISHKNMQSVS